MDNTTISDVSALYDKFDKLMRTVYSNQETADISLTKKEARTVMGALMSCEMFINMTDDRK